MADPAKLGLDGVLASKLASTSALIRRCALPREMAMRCKARMACGHGVWGANSWQRLNLRAEASEELADAVNYVALARLRNRQGTLDSLLQWLACALLGVVYRLVGRGLRKDGAR